MTEQLTRISLERVLSEFLLDRRARGCSPRTIEFYDQQLGYFSAWLSAKGITLSSVTPACIRDYLLDREQSTSAWTVHAAFRAIRALFTWASQEYDDPWYVQIVSKIRAPRLPKRKESPVPTEHVSAMLKTCISGEWFGDRDRAIILTLYDSGLRASELLALNVGDVADNGGVYVRKGKGDKSRIAAVGAKTRRAIHQWLNRHRSMVKDDDPLFTNVHGNRLTYSGLRGIVNTRAEYAQVPKPRLHAFRRAWALTLLRGGVNVYALQSLGGWADLEIVQRYLKQTEEDVLLAHASASPGDALG